MNHRMIVILGLTVGLAGMFPKGCLLSAASGKDVPPGASRGASAFEQDVFEHWGRRKPKRIETPYYPKEPFFVYHAYMTDVTRVPSAPLQEDYPPLPNSLIIPPGTYQFHGRAFALRGEGLYRFVYLAKENQQRIVYKSNVDALLSSIAWIASHGNSDNGKPLDALTAKAKTSKLLVTCGPVSSWAASLLASQGVKWRYVSSLTLEHWNFHDDAHVLIEVYRDRFHKWIVYDLDMNSYFVRRGTPLSLVEFAYAVVNDCDYQIRPLAKDTRLDVSHFASKDFGYAFLAERNIAACREWYKRVMQVPMIHSGRHYYFFDEANRPRIQDRLKNRRYMEKDEFQKRFYPESQPTN